jgi:membrane protein required for colicin V production
VKATAFAAQAVGGLSSAQSSMIFFGFLVLGGEAIAAALRMAVDEMVGADVGLLDRLAGSALGVVRVGLVAITAVLVPDRVIPSGRDSAFLVGSQLRPLFRWQGRRA